MQTYIAVQKSPLADGAGHTFLKDSLYMCVASVSELLNGPRTITKPQALDSEIEATRRHGYAQDDEEFSPGIRCAAVPVYARPGDMIAAIGVSGPTARISLERLAELGALVAERTAAISNWSKT